MDHNAYTVDGSSTVPRFDAWESPAVLSFGAFQIALHPEVYFLPVFRWWGSERIVHFIDT